MGTAGDIRPFLKVPLQRRKITSLISSYFPSFINDSSFNYIEPFLGNGEGLFGMVSTENVIGAYCLDGNPSLVNAYSIVRDAPEELISLLNHMQNGYSVLNESERRTYYEYFRRIYNENASSNVEYAAQYIFLNQTCYKGMYRTNLKGKFNVPFGNPKYPTICDRDVIRADSSVLRHCTIINSSYREAESLISGNCLAFLDIPADYGHVEHECLRRFLDDISGRCSFVCVAKDLDGGFMDGIYIGYQVSPIGDSWNVIRN